MIYLDHNASTPLAKAAAAAMLPILETAFGNPSSGHWAGRPARTAIERARGQVANLLECNASEIVFTSGGTEANNLALAGICLGSDEPCHLVTSAIEHPAIVEPCRFLEQFGVGVTFVPVDGAGLVDPDAVRRAMTPTTKLVSVMHANNEVGTIQPIRELARIAHERGALMHTDAAQSVGKVSIRVPDLGVDLLSVAGHKLYGPKGVGALFVRSGVTIEPFLRGAGHESGRRPGTENTLGIVGLGAACASAEPWIDHPDVAKLRDRLWDRLRADLGDRVRSNGHPTRRLPNTLNVAFPGIVGADLLAKLPEVAASTGSACHSGSVRLSPVLEAMGIDPKVGMGAVRFSLGRATTEAEIDTVSDRLLAILRP